MAAASSDQADGASERLEWDGREIEPRHVTFKVYEEAQSMTPQDRLLHIMIGSLHYKDDGSKVFKARAEIGDIPNVRMFRVWKFAMACAEFNKPPEEENPFPKA